MPAGVYLLGHAAYLRAHRQRQASRKRCKFCGKPAHRFRACVAHRAYQAAWKRQQRAERKAAA